MSIISKIKDLTEKRRIKNELEFFIFILNIKPVEYTNSLEFEQYIADAEKHFERLCAENFQLDEYLLDFFFNEIDAFNNKNKTGFKQCKLNHLQTIDNIRMRLNGELESAPILFKQLEEDFAVEKKELDYYESLRNNNKEV